MFTQLDWASGREALQMLGIVAVVIGLAVAIVADLYVTRRAKRNR